MTITDPQPAAATSPVDHAPGDREMTMLEHLQELRHRLVVSIIAVIGGILVSIIPVPGFGSITTFVLKLLVSQAPGERVTVLSPTEGFISILEVSLIIGIAMAMPVLVYQVLAFVAPALYPKEKRYLYLAIPGATLSFLAGVLFCYHVMLPFAINFLGNFATDIFKNEWAAQRFLSFVITFVFWVGVTFEMPIVMYFLSKLGVVSAQQMVRFRRYALVLSFIFGAMITPTPDPLNQIIVSLPIYFLFELGIILARFA
jgi:sec-independent protein translocase protein TatC